MQLERSGKTSSKVFQVVKYLAVGGSTALLELFLFWILCIASAGNLIFSNIVAVVVATCANFLLNGKVTFQSSGNMFRSAILYVLLFAFNLAFSTTAIPLLSGWGMPPVIAKALTQGCIVAWNFVLYRKVVFK